MNLGIVLKFKECKLQLYEKRRLFRYFSVNPCMPASRWNRPIERASERVPFSTSYLQLARAYARNSRVKKRGKDREVITRNGHLKRSLKRAMNQTQDLANTYPFV